MELSRRNFVIGGATSVAVASGASAGRAAAHAPKKLIVGTRQIEVFGKPATRYAIFQEDHTFGMTLDQGDLFDVDLVNTLAVPTLVHWHGFVDPWRQDGVPYLTAPPIPPKGSRRFTFHAKPAGTRWMHSHFGLQEQNLLSAPFIVRERSAIRADAQEVVVMLADFTWREPEAVFKSLRTASMSMSMKKGGADLDDVDYDAVLANGRTLDAPEVIRADAGGRVRLRLINASASSNHTVDLGSVRGTLITVDGNPILPIEGSRFPITVAQRLDILVTMPTGGGAIPVIFREEGSLLRSAIILATKRAAVSKLPVKASSKGPRLTLDLERRLRPSRPLPQRKADRRFMVDLMGSMRGYVWQMAVQGLPGMPLSVGKGERVEVEMRNQTSMAHPMHLHGHVFQVVAINGRRFAGAMRDTVLVPPKTSVTFAIDADNPGQWAFHCHNLYHLAAGMFTTMDYRKLA